MLIEVSMWITLCEKFLHIFSQTSIIDWGASALHSKWLHGVVKSSWKVLSMNEIKCPKCGEAFKIDEAGYADIAKQVRDKECSLALQEKLDQAERDKQSALQLAQTAKEGEIKDLKNALYSKDLESQLAVTKAVAEIENKKNDELRLMNEELEKYKAFKSKLPTKMLGETLEKHCEIEFNKIRSTGFQRAYF